MVFITVVESVYSAVRTDSLHKADYVSSLKGSCVSYGSVNKHHIFSKTALTDQICSGDPVCYSCYLFVCLRLI